MTFRSPHLFAAAVLCAAMLAGPAACTPKPPHPTAIPPPIYVPKTFSQSGDRAMGAKWWLSLDDERLSALIERALAGNLDLAGTWDRLAEARAVARKAGAALEPSLSASAGVSHTRYEGPVASRGRTANDVSLGLVAGYELDLWGRIRSTRDAAEMNARATRADLDAAAITLSARVAETWYALVDSAAQIALLDEQIETNEKYLKIVSIQVRKSMKGANPVDELQQRQRLATTRSQRIQALSRREVLTHQLAVLLGLAPMGVPSDAEGTLPPLPPLPDTGLPADLVTRRPDIRAAALRLAGADHALAAAIADRFPRISLSARAETSGTKARDLFNNWLATLAANLTAPILDGDLRQAEIDRARAAADGSLHAYGQTVLEALREVEDALAAERRQGEYLDHIRKQLDLSQKIVDLTWKNYNTTGYLRILDALRSHQTLQRLALTGRLDLIRFRINLYRALGGSWDLRRPARPAGAAATTHATD